MAGWFERWFRSARPGALRADAESPASVRPVTPPAIVADRYEILAGFSQSSVYKVRDIQRDDICALKLGHEDEPRFWLECKALDGLRHPNIVQLRGFGSDHGVPYLAMGFVDGPNLAQLLKTGRPTLTDTLAIARQVASALAFLHDPPPASGFVSAIHRNIRPSNILLRNTVPMQAVVGGFGLVKLGNIEERTTTGTLLGKYSEYTAPEQLGLKRQRERVPVDLRADIYAFGLVLYELLEGKPFHAGLEPQELLGRLLFEREELEPEFAQPVDPTLRALVARMMRRYPDDRPESMALVARELESVFA